MESPTVIICTLFNSKGTISGWAISECLGKCENPLGTLGALQEGPRWDLQVIHSVSRQRFLRFCDKTLHNSA